MCDASTSLLSGEIFYTQAKGQKVYYIYCHTSREKVFFNQTREKDYSTGWLAVLILLLLYIYK
jgi:hypothetical protein